MDELASTRTRAAARDPLGAGYRGRTRACANLDRIKQAVWDAFHGTAPADLRRSPAQDRSPSRCWLRPGRGRLAGRDPAERSRRCTSARENVGRPTDEATQAENYARRDHVIACDPTVRSLHLLPPDGRARPRPLAERARSAPTARSGPRTTASRQTIAQTHGDLLRRRSRPVAARDPVIVSPARFPRAACSKPLHLGRGALELRGRARADAGDLPRPGNFKAGPARPCSGARLATGEAERRCCEGRHDQGLAQASSASRLGS